MADTYDHQAIEKKWQDKWFSTNMFKADDTDDRPKYYALDMFPYPSGAGLHVGHPEGYTATDIISRYMRMKGYNVLHPMGWDAFGLPAENYAIKTQVHPEESTLKNITTFKRQIQELGFSYDWEREIATCLPDYYKWTQWFFHFLYKNDLAYKKEAPVNWCDDCHTVLANEQVVNGKCERCKNDVHQKNLSQWFFKITDFLEESEHEGRKTSGLLDGLVKIDWPESTKIGQRNWIGKSKGCDVSWKVDGHDLVLDTFTTTVDTIYGVTFVVISPEHPELMNITSDEQREAVQKYATEAQSKSELDRMEVKDKTGVDTGAQVIHPFTGEKVPLWVADYVLMSYGTGIVMGVPAHDQRDMDFAKKYGFEIIQSIQDKDGNTFVYDDVDKYRVEGKIIDSGDFSGLPIQEGRQTITEKLEELGQGNTKVQYKMRDWLVSRQRYWGAPIPMVFDDQDNEYLIPVDELPVELPKDVDFNPTGESPLTNSESFHNPEDLKRIEDKLKASGDMPAERTLVRRESDTMDTFVCSSWYQFRFMDPKNDQEFASKEMLQKWGPVDLYVGGAEHTVLHLLYARFFTKALHRFGYIDYDEPFTKLRHQGMILGEDGEKMSKSRGNVINPDSIVTEYGCDTLRLYEMFMGPFKDMKPWSMSGVQGVYRFLQKVWRLGTEGTLTDSKPSDEMTKIMHKTLKKVTHDIEDFKFNTAISQMMIMVNELQKLDEVPKAAVEWLIICLYPYAPHLTEELWEILGHKDMLMKQEWPAYDEELAKDDLISLPIQVNGRMRGAIEVSPDIDEADALAQAKEQENVKKFIDGKEIAKEIFVPGKIVNIVVKG